MNTLRKWKNKIKEEFEFGAGTVTVSDHRQDPQEAEAKSSPKRPPQESTAETIALEFKKQGQQDPQQNPQKSLTTSSSTQSSASSDKKSGSLRTIDSDTTRSRKKESNAGLDASNTRNINSDTTRSSKSSKSDAQTKEPEAQPETHAELVSSVGVHKEFNYGFDEKVTMFSYHPQLQLFAFAFAGSNRVIIVGRDDVYYHVPNRNPSPIEHIHFFPHHLALATISEDGTLQTWSLPSLSSLGSLKLHAITPNKVTTIRTPISLEWMILGDDFGQVRFVHAPFDLYFSACVISGFDAGGSKEGSPTVGVEYVEEEGEDLLIGWKDGTIILWNMLNTKLVRKYSRSGGATTSSPDLTAMTMSPSRKYFLAAWANLDVFLYTVTSPSPNSQRTLRPTIDVGEVSQNPILKLDWSFGPGLWTHESERGQTVDMALYMVGGMDPKGITVFGSKDWSKSALFKSHSKNIDFELLYTVYPPSIPTNAGLIVALDNHGNVKFYYPNQTDLEERFLIPVLCQHAVTYKRSYGISSNYSAFVAELSHMRSEASANLNSQFTDGVRDFSNMESFRLLVTGHTQGMLAFWELYQPLSSNAFRLINTINLRKFSRKGEGSIMMHITYFNVDFQNQTFFVGCNNGELFGFHLKKQDMSDTLGGENFYLSFYSEFHQADITSITFLPTSAQVATGDRDGKFSIHKMETSENLFSSTLTSPISLILNHPTDSKQMIVCSGKGKILSFATDKFIFSKSSKFDCKAKSEIMLMEFLSAKGQPIPSSLPIRKLNPVSILANRKSEEASGVIFRQSMDDFVMVPSSPSNQGSPTPSGSPGAPIRIDEKSGTLIIPDPPNQINVWKKHFFLLNVKKQMLEYYQDETKKIKKGIIGFDVIMTSAVCTDPRVNDRFSNFYPFEMDFRDATNQISKLVFITDAEDDMKDWIDKFTLISNRNAGIRVTSPTPTTPSGPVSVISNFFSSSKKEEPAPSGYTSEEAQAISHYRRIIENLEAAKKAAVDKEDYNSASELKRQIGEVQKSIDTIIAAKKDDPKTPSKTPPLMSPVMSPQIAPQPSQPQQTQQLPQQPQQDEFFPPVKQTSQTASLLLAVSSARAYILSTAFTIVSEFTFPHLASSAFILNIPSAKGDEIPYLVVVTNDSNNILFLSIPKLTLLITTPQFDYKKYDIEKEIAPTTDGFIFLSRKNNIIGVSLLQANRDFTSKNHEFDEVPSSSLVPANFKLDVYKPKAKDNIKSSLFAIGESLGLVQKISVNELLATIRSNQEEEEEEREREKEQQRAQQKRDTEKQLNKTDSVRLQQGSSSSSSAAASATSSSTSKPYSLEQIKEDRRVRKEREKTDSAHDAAQRAFMAAKERGEKLDQIVESSARLENNAADFLANVKRLAEKKR